MIAIGYTDTPDCQAALVWAAAEAMRENEPLTVISAIPMPSFVEAGTGAAAFEPDDLADVAERLVNDGVERAKALGVKEVHGKWAIGNPAEVIVDQAEGARLLAIGNRGHGPLLSTLLGSVSYAICAHAPCPVVVIRENAPSPDADHPVVVGLDTSEQATRAAAFAADLASRAKAPLKCYAVWTDPTFTLASSYVDAAALSIGVQVEDAVQKRLTESMDELRASHPGLTVTGEVLEGDPARRLVESAEGAGALVIGTRGLGGFRGMMLGSVSHGVLHNAPCPVALIR